METFLFNELVFGPVESRRFGSSLGINLLSTSHKICNYNCVYCECGLTGDLRNLKNRFADIQNLEHELEQKLSSQEALDLDVITYAGNGEPTLHPRFSQISKIVRSLRDKYTPWCKIVLLTNGTTLRKSNVRNALKYIDTAVIKLDAGTDEMLNDIDHPNVPIRTIDLVNQIKLLPFDFTIQTMFLKGEVYGNKIDNTTTKNVKSWIELLQKMNPKMVMIYTIARNTPFNSIKPVSQTKLESIASLVRKAGINTLVS